MKEYSSQFYPVLIVLLAAIVGAIAQYCFKNGSTQIIEISIYKNFYFLGGLILFVLVLALITFSFRLGGEMAIVYPCYGSTYIWSLLISRYIEKDQINSFQVAGIAFVILGIGLIAKSK
jgi:drug/metabolite transporter (DMT)-like permease